jgi:hypothetical protein
VVARGALGTIEAVLPELTERWLWSSFRFDRRDTIVVRILGGRQFGQALLTYLAPQAKVAVAGAVVDAIHAASMMVLAIRSTRWRRAALVEAALATVLSALGVVISRDMRIRATGVSSAILTGKTRGDLSIASVSGGPVATKRE